MLKLRGPVKYVAGVLGLAAGIAVWLLVGEVAGVITAVVVVLLLPWLPVPAAIAGGDGGDGGDGGT